MLFSKPIQSKFMQAYIKGIGTALFVLLLFSGCKKRFESDYVNTNKPTNVPPSLLFNGILNQMLDAPGGQIDRTNQYQIQNNSYFGNNQYTFGSGDNYYPTLISAEDMGQEAIASGLAPLNPYEALAKFFKAYFFGKMSLEMGDIPMTQALAGLKDLTPVYDPQKTVFKNIFLWLDSANTDLAALIAKNDQTLTGDIYLNNNLTAWQKVVNSFRLRMLLHLTNKVTSDPDLGIAQQFATIIGNPQQYPLMQGAKDNLQYTWIYPTNPYPLNPGGFANGALNNSTTTYVGLLTSLQDPRVFVTTDPAPGLVTAGGSPTAFSSFQGGAPGAAMATLSSQNGGGVLSYINRWRYYNTYTGEPTIIVGYPELCFNIAAAINMGWLSSGPLGNAEAYYIAGIQSSMASYGIPLNGTLAVYSLPQGVSVGGPYVTSAVNVNFSSWYSQPTVAYAGNSATGLTQIFQQRYIALYLHSGLESYFTWRRTGVPTFSSGPGTGNSGRIALRYQYLSADKSSNAANYQAAIVQYGGVDDINGKMWILQ
jgi:Starch-binding associating with outer membrane